MNLHSHLTGGAEMQLLALSGSLRSALLHAAKLVAQSGLDIKVHNYAAALPHFSPDLEMDPPEVVGDLRSAVGDASGLLISCPEYARGVPGSFKNLLWLVGSSEFPGKPVALFWASQRWRCRESSAGAGSGNDVGESGARPLEVTGVSMFALGLEWAEKHASASRQLVLLQLLAEPHS